TRFGSSITTIFVVYLARKRRQGEIQKKEQEEEKMALQWLILSYVVAAEVVIAVVLTLPYPMVVKKRVVSLVSLILQPAASIVAFAAFQLCDIYWKNEHRLSCSSEVCTATERDRYEKSIYKAQRNVVLCAAGIFLYWCIYRICKYNKDLELLEEAEKRHKDE
uniref:Endoplasmic reticulum transmembrane protein n=2 Tax=Brassica TaxID=3705 RepID=A0A0D3DJQ9_BRAOL